MATLHLVSRGPAESRALEDCLARAGRGDAVLLLGDGVYGACAEAGEAIALRSAGRVALYVLAPDMAARGLEPERLPEGILPLDYAGFVALTIDHSPVQSWF